MRSLLNYFKYSSVIKICEDHFIVKGRFSGLWIIIEEKDGVANIIPTEIRSEKTARKMAVSRISNSIIDNLKSQKIDFSQKYGTINEVIAKIESFLDSGMNINSVIEKLKEV